MNSLGTRDACKELGLGFGSGRDMEDTELEEGEACSDHINNDCGLDPDIDLSYLDVKLQDVLGHFQKNFERGDVSAENLGPTYGGYGSFLPAYQRSPVWSRPRTPPKIQHNNAPRSSPKIQHNNAPRSQPKIQHNNAPMPPPKIQHNNAPRSPNNSLVEGGRHGSVSSSTAPQSIKPEPACTTVLSQTSSNSVKQDVGLPCINNAKEHTLSRESGNRKSACTTVLSQTSSNSPFFMINDAMEHTSSCESGNRKSVDLPDQKRLKFKRE